MGFKALLWRDFTSWGRLQREIGILIVKVNRPTLNLPSLIQVFGRLSYFLNIGNWKYYREVQLDLTPEIEVLYMLFERCHTKDRKRSLNSI